MGNLVKVQFNGILDGHRLQPFGTMKLSVLKIESPSSSTQWLSLEGNGHIITVNKGGYFALSYDGLSDPSARLTSYTIQGSNVVTLFFKNDNYDIFISNKYNNTTFKTIIGIVV